MAAMDRLVSERTFHDQQASLRRLTFEQKPEGLVVSESDYLDHETWIRPAFNQLGDVAGLRVLDYGCGHAMAAVILAQRGGRVTAFDLSGGYLSEAGRRAQANGVRIDLVQADGERLPFADCTFDRVWGNAVLHHLDLDRAASELRRVLRPDGVAVFCEPWGGNPLLRWVRRRMPYQGKARTADEEPLRVAHLRQLWRHFPRMQIQGFQLLSMAQRILRQGRLRRTLDRCDGLLLSRAPSLQHWCRYVVLRLPR
jgi:ubiquinone/menaquinone biosynthesis C-methylase UbiE